MGLLIVAGREWRVVVRHSGAERSEEPGIHNHRRRKIFSAIPKLHFS